ncbi:hypothetical protein [Kribbella endophytica]
MREWGSEGPAAWTAEWEMRGEVVFPQRRRSLYWRLGLFGFLTLSSGWQLVDNLRDETELPWDRIATISDPIGRWLYAYLNVRPADGKPRRLPISHMHVADLRPFALWLRSRLEEQRVLAGASTDDQGGRARPGDLWRTGDM